MREIRCRHCGHYLLSAEADAGRLAITCRSCKRRQTVDLRPPQAKQSAREDAGAPAESAREVRR